MMRICFVLFSLFAYSASAQLKSPEEFLGYKIGSRYTPHWRVVSYFQYVAQSAPSMVKLQQYGETNEHRPLYLTFIASETNMDKLETIRQNNLRLAGLANDNTPASEDAPAVVWLSYNVHGNETSSSEAALLTLYALVDPSNSQTKEWLKNTVVIMDPCVNPDGRDRYVNWFNSVVGAQYNPRLDAREHREPWPGGRTNHYNFDLNRDWAWQTQLESRQRIKQYNQWMPQVHVDFHEQGINQPYYFAPAAQPYHEVITKFQRDFQVKIGKNNAKYFDQNNWLYFTREVFDLFYPSYGDTYPVYNGAIGMTYEQGGGGAGGLGVDTDEGDTLTLYDRAIHHYTTSLSTIEVASTNTAALLKEFRKFFNDAIAGNVGDYKSYVIKNKPEDQQRIKALKNLLDKNGIQYGYTNTTGKGYDYAAGKEGSFSGTTGDLVINAAQPRGAMVKVLFEPESKLVDSVTYDITSWALPYVYGLSSYASKTKLAAGTTSPVTFTPNQPADAYGYVIRWQGTGSAKAVTQLLKKKIRLRVAESPFESGGNNFDRGSIIILKNGNEKYGNKLWQIVAEAANENELVMTPINSGMVDKGYDFGSSYVRAVKPVTIAMLTGEGVGSNAAGEIWHFVEKELDYPITLINANDFGRANLDKIDVLILPDGNYRFLNEKVQGERLKSWISNGGRIIALESAVGQLASQEWSTLKLKKNGEEKDDDSKKDPYEILKAYGNRERDAIPAVTPGAVLRVELDNTHPLMFGYPKYYYTLKQDDKVYEFIKEGGWNAGVFRKDDPVAGFVGYKLKKQLKDGLVFGVQDMGRGSITYLTDNVLFRNFWENGKLMFANALFMVAQ